MAGSTLVILELILIFGIVLGLAIWDLWRTKKK